MGRYLLRRLLLAPVVLLVLVTISFFLMRAAPGGPFSSERSLDPVVEKAMLAQYHLDEPLPMQYLRFLGQLARGDLGPSFKYKSTTVGEIIAAKLPCSLLLGALALLVAVAVGVTAGVAAAARHNTLVDHATMTVAILGLSFPTFVIGPMLALVFALYLQWLPPAGYEGPLAVSYLILPVLTLAAPFAARIARLTRAGMLEVLHQDFVRTARAKGLSEFSVICRHALRGGVLPVVSFLGPGTADLLTGSLVVEQIFQVPGLGREFVESSLNRDYTLVLGLVIVYGVLVILFNLIADLLTGVIDPRVRLT